MVSRLALAAAAALCLALCGCTAQGRALQPEGGAHAVEDGPCRPTQLHISVTGNPTEMRVSWKTRGGSCPSAVTAGPAAALAQNPMDPSLLHTHRGRQHSYSAEDTCASPARDLGWGTTFLHTTVLTGLVPGDRYFYQVEGGPPVEFAAAAPAGPHGCFTFLVFGDMGESEHREAKSPGAGRTAELLHGEYRAGADLALHIGDISYANGREHVWDAFMDSIEPFARHMPYLVGVGNHEYDYERGGGNEGGGAARLDPSGETSSYQPPWGNFGNDSGGECGVQISNRFQMPDVADYGYWSWGLTAEAAEAAMAGADGGSSRGGNGSVNGWPRNPTLGPHAGVFLAGLRQQQAEGAQRRAAMEVQAPVAVGGAAASAGTDSSSGGVGTAGSGPDRPNAPFWYSLSYGPIHFVVLSTEHSLQPGSRQYRWLVRDLAQVDRCSTPWVVVGMHRPMYVVYPHKSNRIVGDHLRAQLEGLLNHYQVDLVVSGHVHSYSRTCNVLGERCVPADEGGMTHVIVGCAGHKLTDIIHDQERWLEYAAVRFGYGRVAVDGAASLTFELVGDDGEVHDSVKLHNSRAALRGCSPVAAADGAHEASTAQA